MPIMLHEFAEFTFLVAEKLVMEIISWWKYCPVWDRVHVRWVGLTCLYSFLKKCITQSFSKALITPLEFVCSRVLKFELNAVHVLFVFSNAVQYKFPEGVCEPSICNYLIIYPASLTTFIHPIVWRKLCFVTFWLAQRKSHHRGACPHNLNRV